MTRTTSYLSILPVAAAALLLGCVNAPDGGKDSDFSGDSGRGDVTHSVNGSIHVPSGQKASDVSTVNGGIHVEDNATVAGANTVNGDIHIGAHSAAQHLNTVNGPITLADGAHVDHAVTSVNGGLKLAQGAEVGGALTNVNGKIELMAAHVAGGIETVNGDIDVGSNSRVEGGIHVHKQQSQWFGNWSSSNKPRIVIGPGAVVQGDLKFEREVDLYVSDRATIGPVTGATPQKFSGDVPRG